MSLVSDALKKAERDAAAREAREKGLPAPLDAPLQPYRSRRANATAGGRRTALAVPLLALLAGAAVVAAFFLSRSTREEKAPVNEEEKASVKEGSSPLELPPAPPSASEPTTTQPATPPLPKTTLDPAPAPPSASESPAPQQATLPLPKRTQDSSSAAPSASEPPSPKPAAPSTHAAAPAGGRPGDYLRKVELRDGTRLELGGIVYSEAAPFAYLNGRLVGVGEFVEGFRIDRIERERVTLTGDAGTYTLRLKGP